METLNKIKLAVVGIAGAITAVFGWMGWLVIGFAACMLLDWITGSVAGSKKDGWSSATARAGLWHKGGMLVVVVVACWESSSTISQQSSCRLNIRCLCARWCCAGTSLRSWGASAKMRRRWARPCQDF
jgi:phage-related holin